MKDSLTYWHFSNRDLLFEEKAFLRFEQRETMNNIGVIAVLCIGAIYGAYALGFYPMQVSVAALGLLAFVAFSRPPAKKPPVTGHSYMDD
jgi:hypothetical protein